MPAGAERQPRAASPGVHAWVVQMLEKDEHVWRAASCDFALRERMSISCQTLVTSAYLYGNVDSLQEAHELLSTIYAIDFGSAQPAFVDADTQPILRELAALVEEGMLADEVSQVDSEQLHEHPKSGAHYVDWLKRLISDHPASSHPLYGDYVATRAGVRELAFLMTQEASLDPRFDDILALLQIGLPPAQKLELADNYYDEMGRGVAQQMHSTLFAKALHHLGVDAAAVDAGMLLEAKIAGNLSACLALGRRHRFKAIGYYGVTEYLAPRRFKHVVAAWTRNALPAEGIEYHETHIRIDADHARGWMHNVIAPAVEQNPRAGFEIALGASIRLNSSRRYLEAILAHFRRHP